MLCRTYDTDDYQAVGIGPGLGRNEETEAALIEQLEHCQTPTVLDADALNILPITGIRSPICRKSILTPHPKELERLVGKCQDSLRTTDESLRTGAQLAKVHIILKGAYSAIITPEGNVTSTRPVIPVWQQEAAEMY